VPNILLVAISCPTALACLATGANGAFATTTNGGTTWTMHSTGKVNNHLLGVSCPNAATCFAVGTGGIVLASTNFGGAWTQQSSGTTSDLNGVSCPTAMACFAVGRDSTILVTTNGGATWAPQNANLSLTDQINGVSCPDARDCYAVTASGSIDKTTDGATWMATAAGVGLFAVACAGTTTCIAAGGGVVVISGPSVWTQATAGTNNTLYGAACSSAATCIVTGENGTILGSPSVPPQAPTDVHALAGDSEATVTWTPPASAGSSPITSYRVTASPGGLSTTVSPLVPAATITGLTDGTTYAFSVEAINASGAGPASGPSNMVTPLLVQAATPMAVLPAMSNNAYGGYVTVAYIENLSPTLPAHVFVQYYQPAGGLMGGNTLVALPPQVTWTLRQDNAFGPFDGMAGSAVVYSDRPIAAFVNEFAPANRSDATSYTGIAASLTGPTLYAPAIASAAYGGYTTGIGLINMGDGATDVQITYRDASGAVAGSQLLRGVASHAYEGVYSGNSGSATDARLPAGFAGTATIQSVATPGQPLAAVVNEVGPGGQFSSYDAVASGNQTLQAPTALSNAYGGFNTGIGIQNTSATAGSVAISYYDATGTLVKTSPFQIAAYGSLGVYQGTDVAAGAYTARITSSTAGVTLAAIVNEVAPANGSARQSTSYNTFGGSATSANLPLVESAGADGWSTGLGIMNTGSTATTVAVTYFDAATGAPIGTAQSQMLAPNAFWGLYQPTGGLPLGSRANALVTSNSGATVAVICNEVNATSFMSYDGQ
jgi:photosystem II stability/assembly factor-like uncharacterized protein